VLDAVGVLKTSSSISLSFYKPAWLDEQGSMLTDVKSWEKEDIFRSFSYTVSLRPPQIPPFGRDDKVSVFTVPGSPKE
jgi:hypothetical protein